MDVNSYMEKSLALQEQAVALLKQMVSGTGTITTVVNTTHDEVLVKEAVSKASTGKADAKKGSTKQAANHAKDDNEPPFEPATDTPKEKAAFAADKAKEPTSDDVRAALMLLGKREGSEAAIALLQKHGATSVSSLDKSVYAELIADAAA